MSWAAHREARHEEDVAYPARAGSACAFRRFHGEGGRAFIKLQEEIIKETEDASIYSRTAFERRSFEDS